MKHAQTTATVLRCALTALGAALLCVGGGNEINLFVQGGSQVDLGAALVIVLMVILAVGMSYYVVQSARDARALNA